MRIYLWQPFKRLGLGFIFHEKWMVRFVWHKASPITPVQGGFIAGPVELRFFLDTKEGLEKRIARFHQLETGK
jgi:hypothetical protein